ncbi:hypothetical protein HDU98_010323 [Podochytrium sp. JEL0797]|nr:hypothetical protein HDU98_010323 [Podochytrium sp. JEL0797]
MTIQAGGPFNAPPKYSQIDDTSSGGLSSGNNGPDFIYIPHPPPSVYDVPVMRQPPSKSTSSKFRGALGAVEGGNKSTHNLIGGGKKSSNTLKAVDTGPGEVVELQESFSSSGSSGTGRSDISEKKQFAMLGVMPNQLRADLGEIFLALMPVFRGG